MNDFFTAVVSNIVQEFSPAALIAVLLVNLVTELIQRIRRGEKAGSLVRETVAFVGVIAIMTGWALLALGLPIGLGRVAGLNQAPVWTFVAGVILYLLAALPLGYLMLGLLLGAQQTDFLSRRELSRRRTPVYVYASLFKIGFSVIAISLAAIPVLGGMLGGFGADRAALMRFTLVMLLLADTACYGWVLVAE